MLFRKTPIAKSGLEVAIDEVLSEMKGFTADQDEYAIMADQLVKLYALKEVDRPVRAMNDAVIMSLGNVICVALILEYERVHVVTSKALLFIGRLR